MDLISWDHFDKVDIRTGTITEAKPFPKARKPSYQLLIDFGEMGTRTSSAQITTHYNLEELVGREVIAIINFPPRQIANFFSECLVLGVYDKDGEVVLLKPDKPVGNGRKIG